MVRKMRVIRISGVRQLVSRGKGEVKVPGENRRGQIQGYLTEKTNDGQRVAVGIERHREDQGGINLSRQEKLLGRSEIIRTAKGEKKSEANGHRETIIYTKSGISTESSG